MAFSKERREERGRQLRNELNNGYLHDIKAMKQQNGRAFVSELELLAKVDSAVFPHIACNDLRGHSVAPADLLRGKCVAERSAKFTAEIRSHARLCRCSIVTVAIRDSADRDLQQWVTGLGLRDASCPWNWVELSFIDNWLLKTMNAQMTAKLAEKVPVHRHPLYLVSCVPPPLISQLIFPCNRFP